MDSRSDFEKLIEASEKRVFNPFCDYDPQQDSFFLFTRDGAKTAEQISGALKVFRSYDSEEFVGIEIRKVLIVPSGDGAGSRQSVVTPNVRFCRAFQPDKKRLWKGLST